MAVSNSIIRKFVELTKEADTSTGYYVYGTAIVNSEGKYVKVDGSDSVTSVSIATDIISGDRVLVYIEGHKASVIGNVTCPASGRTAVDVSDMLEDFSSLVVGALYATYAEIESIRANYVTTEYLEATYATITDLKVVFESVDYLYAGVANIETLLGGEGGFGELQSIHLSADNAVIDTAVIVNAVAGTVMADLILSDFINTDLIKIGSTDGTLWIDGSTILIIDANKNYRIQIGLDNNGDYNLALWDEDGNCMWNASGATEYGINDGVIRDDMVAADAAIQGSKLDIESICSIINENGDYVINAGSVKIDDQSLDAWYTQITQQIEGLEGLSTENLRNLEPWFCLWKSDTEPPEEATRTINEEYSTYESGNIRTITIDVSFNDLLPTEIISFDIFDWNEYPFEVINYYLDGSSLVIEVETGYVGQQYEFEITAEIVYSSVIWVNYDIQTEEGMYKWVKWLGTYNDGHTEWSTPYCLTDGYIRTTTSVLQTELSVVQGQIEAYVWETETALNELEESVKDTWAAIEIDIGKIQQTVGNMETTLYGDDESVGLTTQVSLIEQTADSISESVNSVVSWLGDGYSSSLSLDTCITQYVDEASSNILLKVSSSYATIGEAVKAIQNYYCLSDNIWSPGGVYVNEDFSGGSLPSGWSRNSTAYISFGSSDILGSYARICPSSGSAYLYGNSIVGTLSAGKYILRFKAATEAGYESTAEVQVRFPSSSNSYAKTFSDLKSDEWTQFELEYELTSDTRSYLYFYNTITNVPILITDVIFYGDDGSWGTVLPTVPDGYYLWVRQFITYADGTTEWIGPYCVTDDLSNYPTLNVMTASIEEYVDDSLARISLTVSGSLGGTASIILTSGDNPLAYGDIDLSKVREAFANDNTAITISGHAITFISNSLVVESDRFKLNANGDLYIDTNQLTLDWDGNATFSGTLSAPTGRIGGWYISLYRLYNGPEVAGDYTNGTCFDAIYSEIWQYHNGNYLDISSGEITNGYVGSTGNSGKSMIISRAMIKMYEVGDVLKAEYQEYVINFYSSNGNVLAEYSQNNLEFRDSSGPRLLYLSTSTLSLYDDGVLSAQYSRNSICLYKDGSRNICVCGNTTDSETGTDTGGYTILDPNSAEIGWGIYQSSSSSSSNYSTFDGILLYATSHSSHDYASDKISSDKHIDMRGHSIYPSYTRYSDIYFTYGTRSSDGVRYASLRGGGAIVSTSGIVCMHGYGCSEFDFYENINMHGYSVTNTSDVRLKTKIENSTIDALKVINSIDLKAFDRLDTEEHKDIGIIANQLQVVAPELITEDSDGILGIKQSDLIYYAFKAIQEISEKLGLKYDKAQYIETYSEADKQKLVNKAKQAHINVENEPEPSPTMIMSKED